LSRFDFILEHVPGIKMRKIDRLKEMTRLKSRSRKRQ